MEEEDEFFNDFDVLSQLNLPPSDSDLVPDLYCSEALDNNDDDIIFISDVIPVNTANNELNTAFSIDPNFVPDLTYLSTLQVTTVHTLLDHVRTPWHGYYWKEKADQCVNLEIFKQSYLEHLWKLFFVDINPGSK